MEEYAVLEILSAINCSFQAAKNANIYMSKDVDVLKVVNGYLNASAAAKLAKEIINIPLWNIQAKKKKN